MQVLILGGTVFLGRALTDAVLAHGHQVTHFNRGRSPRAGVETLTGDRDSDLAPLHGRQWDAVIDTCGYVRRVVRKSAGIFAGTHYTFISSLSVYANFKKAGMDESAPVGKLVDETVEQVTGETYGPLKALCEPSGAFVVRPGLIVGPHDPTDRFTYWVRRAAEGGAVLAPGKPENPVRFIDVRDLAKWIVRCVERGVTGTFNADGPVVPMGELLKGNTRIVWVSEEFLLANKVEPWSEMPLWIPESDADNAGFTSVNCAKAVAAGLAYRPVAETVRATLEWAKTRPSDHQWRAGISRDRERELLLRHQSAGDGQRSGVAPGEKRADLDFE
jgi:2'-hydroxyisoflavone reductase